MLFLKVVVWFLLLLVECFSFSTVPGRQNDGIGVTSSKQNIILPSEDTNNLRSQLEGVNFEKWVQDSKDEVPHPKELREVEGEFPKYLKGSLIRNGPALFSTSKRRYLHVFDGMAKLSKYHLNEGKVSFQTRFVQSDWYKSMKDKDQMALSVSTGPVDPPLSKLEGVRALFNSGGFDNTPVNVVQWGGRTGPFVAITDAPVAMEFDPKTLETKGKLQYKENFGVELFSTAHPAKQVDGTDIFNYVLELGVFRENKMHVFRSGSDGRRTLIGTVSVGKEIPYIHQISVTENYAILVKYPVNWPLGGSSDFLRNLEWKGADEPTKIYVFDLKSENLAPIKTFESTPFFSYHHINAFERKEESQIVLDLIGYDTLDIVNSDDGFLYIDKMANPDTRDRTVGGGQVQKTYRLVLDLPGSLSAGATSTFARPFVVPQYFPRRDKTGYMHGTEFPTINSNFNGKPYRYVYGASAYAGLRAATGAPEFANWALIKQDLAAAEGDLDGTTALVWSAPSQYPSEPVFVADPDGSAEDDGVLLSQVYDGHRDEAYLLCLDAQTMLPVAKAYTGRRAGMDFHGKWFDDYDGSL